MFLRSSAWSTPQSSALHGRSILAQLDSRLDRFFSVRFLLRNDASFFSCSICFFLPLFFSFGILHFSCVVDFLKQHIPFTFFNLSSPSPCAGQKPQLT